MLSNVSDSVWALMVVLAGVSVVAVCALIRTLS